MNIWKAAVLLVLLGSCTQRDAEKYVADTLIDPGSAQFRNVQTYNHVVCGQVNGKNALGAYVGFRDFVFDVETKSVKMATEGDSYLPESSRCN